MLKDIFDFLGRAAVVLLLLIAVCLFGVAIVGILKIGLFIGRL